jgi:hypothetical protein
VRRFLPVIALLLASFSAPDSTLADQRVLVVAIGDYGDQRITDLGSKDTDLDRIKTLLTERWNFRAHEIAVLHDGRATKRNILRAFRAWLVNSTQPGDRVVFYYSGHGSHVRDQNGDEKDGHDETLAAYDTVAGRDDAGQITDDEIEALLDGLIDRDVTLIIDSCHAGPDPQREVSKTDDEANRARTFELYAADGATALDNTSRRSEEPFVRGGGMVKVWSAASPGELAYESGGAGVFTRSLWEGAVQGKADRNANGIISNAELLDFTRAEANEYCSRLEACRGNSLTPQLDAAAEALAASFVPHGASPATILGSATDMLGGDNAAGLAIDILPSKQVRIGDSITARLTSGRAGSLILLDVSAEGQLVQLFPNEVTVKHGSDGRIRPSEPLLVPDNYYGFKFTAGEPAGKGTLIAIVAEDLVSFDDLTGPHGDFEPIGDSKSYLATLGRKLRTISFRGRANRALEWSVTTADYEVVQ